MYPADAKSALVEWANHALVLDRAVVILADGLAVGGQRILEDQVVGHQLIDDRWNSASAVIILAEIFAWLAAGSRTAGCRAHIPANR